MISTKSNSHGDQQPQATKMGFLLPLCKFLKPVTTCHENAMKYQMSYIQLLREKDFCDRKLRTDAKT
ncbi:unnamed protein product [Ceratitis capitata]|uniref:(Mediterranean fruit fly) hypothetical protein n=1 Tax=Ceratitis capitata TaxID=7213 RepID=A0A811UDM8_CERCA|nr:unnamed protein product [Ceratitis capitata]